MKRRDLATLCLLGLLLAVAGAFPARAFDDGGGRSVFAHGAGERALALGGAYVAASGGPAVMIWNPAGLAGLDRKQFFAGHTNLIGMGFNEQVGLFAWPSWKLGTLGVGFRRFAVDWIEGRDGRGAVFADNLQDSETEVLLGFARTVGLAWDLGLVFKYQQQSLAGYNDGSPGLDLGVRVKPLLALGRRSSLARGLSLGLAFRNLVEPNLRLDEDGVKDPTGIRFGGAYDGNLGQNLHLLATVDVEKTREMDAHLHAGLELELMKILALRVGSNAGTLSAGAGISYHDLAVDYTVEDNVLDMVHRFGVGMAFGATTAETRQADLDAREAEMQARMAAAYRSENRQRTADILAQARAALADKDFATALRRVEAVKVLDPSQGGLAGLEAEAYFGQGLQREQSGDLSGATIAYQRCLAVDPQNKAAPERLNHVSARANRLAARSAEIRGLFDDALAAYGRDDLVAAREGFGKVLALSPDDREAAALLESTRRTLSRRVGSLLESCRTQALAHDFVAARAYLEKARNLMPDHAGLADAESLITRQEDQVAAARARHVAKPKATRQHAAAGPKPGPKPAPKPAPPTYASLSAKDKREVADLYDKGLASFRQGRNEDAVRYWELVWSRAPDYQKVAANLRQEYLAEGMEAFAAGHLDQAIAIWEKARRVAPEDAKIRGYLARAYEHKSRIREITGEH